MKIINFFSFSIFISSRFIQVTLFFHSLLSEKNHLIFYTSVICTSSSNRTQQTLQFLFQRNFINLLLLSLSLFFSISILSSLKYKKHHDFINYICLEIYPFLSRAQRAMPQLESYFTLVFCSFWIRLLLFCLKYFDNLLKSNSVFFPIKVLFISVYHYNSSAFFPEDFLNFKFMISVLGFNCFDYLFQSLTVLYLS